MRGREIGWAVLEPRHATLRNSAPETYALSDTSNSRWPVMTIKNLIHMLDSPTGHQTLQCSEQNERKTLKFTQFSTQAFIVNTYIKGDCSQFN